MNFDAWSFFFGGILSLVFLGLFRLLDSISLLEKILDILTNHNDNHGGSDDER